MDTGSVCEPVSLSLVGCELGLPGDHSERTRPTVPGSVSKSHTSSWPLQSLSVRNLRLSPRKLQNLIPRLEELTSISLTNIRRTDSSDGFGDHPASQRFWATLARRCLYLRTVSYTTAKPVASQFPVELFPFVVNFGINTWCIMASSWTWQALSNIPRIENYLTTLEIMGQEGDRCIRIAQLRQFLCSSPQLLHLKVVDAWCDREIFFDSLTDISQPCRWACRGLKTLSIDYQERAAPTASRSNMYLFGYIGRVCPKLQGLSIMTYHDDPYLLLNLSLLTRLVDLQWLELRFWEHWDSCHLKGSFAWIQLYNPKAGTWLTQEVSVPPSRLSSFFHSLSKSRDRKLGKDVDDSLNAARVQTLAGRPRRLENNWQGSTTPRKVDDLIHNGWEEQIQRMSQQQRENNYRTNHEREMPMVDGLVGFEFWGSALDVEACLQAQVWRLRQQLDRVSGSNRVHATMEGHGAIHLYRFSWRSVPEKI